MTTRTTTERRDAQQPQELPVLTGIDRLALALGTRLILRTEQHRLRRAERADRADQARAAHADAARAAHDTFEHRTWAGPTW